MIKTYTELIRLSTFEDRFKYLQLRGNVGRETFGFERYLNQSFYRSPEWRALRNHIIERDGCCDLAMPDRLIFDRPIIHHLNPIEVEDITECTDILMNPEFLITTTLLTHNAIHYGDDRYLDLTTIQERRPNDTCPWRNSRG